MSGEETPLLADNNNDPLASTTGPITEETTPHHDDQMVLTGDHPSRSGDLPASLIPFCTILSDHQLRVYKLAISTMSIDSFRLEEGSSFTDAYRLLEHRAPDLALPLTVYVLRQLRVNEAAVNSLSRFVKDQQEFSVKGRVILDYVLSLCEVVCDMNHDAYTRFIEFVKRKFLTNYHTEKLRSRVYLVELLLQHNFLTPNNLKYYFQWVRDAGSAKSLVYLRNFCARQGLEEHIVITEESVTYHGENWSHRYSVGMMRPGSVPTGAHTIDQDGGGVPATIMISPQQEGHGGLGASQFVTSQAMTGWNPQQHGDIRQSSTAVRPTDLSLANASLLTHITEPTPPGNYGTVGTGSDPHRPPDSTGSDPHRPPRYCCCCTLREPLTRKRKCCSGILISMAILCLLALISIVIYGAVFYTDSQTESSSVGYVGSFALNVISCYDPRIVRSVRIVKGDQGKTYNSVLYTAKKNLLTMTNSTLQTKYLPYNRLSSSNAPCNYRDGYNPLYVSNTGNITYNVTVNGSTSTDFPPDTRCTFQLFLFSSLKNYMDFIGSSDTTPLHYQQNSTCIRISKTNRIVSANTTFTVEKEGFYYVAAHIEPNIPISIAMGGNITVFELSKSMKKECVLDSATTGCDTIRIAHEKVPGLSPVPLVCVLSNSSVMDNHRVNVTTSPVEDNQSDNLVLGVIVVLFLLALLFFCCFCKVCCKISCS